MPTQIGEYGFSLRAGYHRADHAQPEWREELTEVFNRGSLDPRGVDHDADVLMGFEFSGKYRNPAKRQTRSGCGAGGMQDAIEIEEDKAEEFAALLTIEVERFHAINFPRAGFICHVRMRRMPRASIQTDAGRLDGRIAHMSQAHVLPPRR